MKKLLKLWNEMSAGEEDEYFEEELTDVDEDQGDVVKKEIVDQYDGIFQSERPFLGKNNANSRKLKNTILE